MDPQPGPSNRRKSDVFKVPYSPPPKSAPSGYAGQRLGEIERDMEAAKESRTLTKVDLSILASLDQAKVLQKELETLQRGKVINLNIYVIDFYVRLIFMYFT